MIYTRDTLKAAVIAWLEEDGAEFAASLDTIIGLAEQQVVKDLPFSIFDQTTAGVLTSATLPKPDGWVSTVDLFITVGNEQFILEPKTWGYVQMYGGTGTPLYFSESSEGAITVAPSPVSTPYTIRYIKRPTSLVNTVPPASTWIATNLPEVLFWSCIVHSEHYRKADERIDQAKGFYTTAVEASRNELAHLLRREYR